MDLTQEDDGIVHDCLDYFIEELNIWGVLGLGFNEVFHIEGGL